jgi:hypothetical protein
MLHKSMPLTVDLDDEFLTRRIVIDDVRLQDVLATKLYATKPLFAKPAPQ